MHLSDLPKIERRNHERWREFAGCRIAVDSYPAFLRDLSATGARFRSSYRPPIDAALMFELPWGQTVRATVLATDDDETRVCFDEPLER